MKIFQINVNKFRRAHDLLYNSTLEMDIDLCLVSEPNCSISSEWGGNAFAKIWRTSKNTYIEKAGQGRGFTWVTTENIMLISVYTSGNDPIEEMDTTLSEISAVLRTWGKCAIIAGDFNAKSPDWRETRSDGRGRKLSEWI